MPRGAAAAAVRSRRSGCTDFGLCPVGLVLQVVGHRIAPATFFVFGSSACFSMSTLPTTTNPPLVCWNCHERTVGTHFCPGCGKVLQLPQQSDYFAMLELPRKLSLEISVLEHKFLQLSWKLHPDNFVNASQEEREISLKRSSELNDAYRTLRDPIARVEYLLAVEGARKEGENKQQAPPELLEEVFELNESLDELRDAKASGGDGAQMSSLRAKLEAAQHKFESSLADVDQELGRVTTEWDRALDSSADDAAQKKVMER